MKTGLYFGSFNPIHIGHLIIANYMREYSDMDEIWFVVSPHNPFKKKKNLLADYHRQELVEISIQSYPKFKACNIEFALPKPSYTIDTLTYLKEKYPKRDFALIMGADNLAGLHKWKNYQSIINDYSIYVYPRPNSCLSNCELSKNICIMEAPLMEISSSFIRTAIKEKKDIPFYMEEKAYRYMRNMHFYE